MVQLTPMHSHTAKQQGVALITILIMIALATILAASIAKKQRFTAEATQSFLRQNQAMLYAESGESFFAELLADDAQNANTVDHLGETWAQPMPAYPVEDGFVSGQLLDANRKFNLNLLLNAEGGLDEAAQAVVMQILSNYRIEPQQVEALIDWIDADDETVGPMGAEQDYYRSAPGQYRPANSAMQQIEELKLIRGFSPAQVEALMRVCTALPVGAKLNINTADAAVLAALIPDANPLLLQDELQTRRDNGEYFSQVDELFALESFRHLDPAYQAQLKSVLDIRSDYYDTWIKVELSQRQRQLWSRLVRTEDGQVHLLFRQLVPHLQTQ